ncbi:MAG: SDR family oxidoreductase [Dehalococcoidales bacterium]|nr:SDR family oxidoreductase [Dehalococcoidales bacterium]
MGIADLFSLHGRVALVTGAAGAMGSQVVTGLAESGADVACVDLTEELASRAAKRVQECGRRVIALRADVSATAEAEAAVHRTVETFGRIDVLVNTAGFSSHIPAEDFPDEQWDLEIGVNLKGTFNFCRAVGRQMIKQGRGSIINFSSIAGAVALGRGQAAYCAAKGAINNLTRELALEWATHGVRVNAVMPCQILTPGLMSMLDDPQFDRDKLMATWLDNIPIRRFGQPDEIVGPVLFLASDAASLVTGHCLAVDGGYLAR